MDKPVGITSNDALQQVKRIYYARKAGHTGSLDPIASGLLPICFGEATKFSQFLLNADKSYFVVAKLGTRTDTGDSDGKIIAQQPCPEFSSSSIEKALSHFRGSISQIPPMYSALKYHGRPLYELARAGITVERQPRPVSIYQLMLVKHQTDTLQLQICCSKGTYIRTLVDDLGQRLGCGAHVHALRRLDVGPFKAEHMISLATLDEFKQDNNRQALLNTLLPIESMVSGLTELSLTASMAFYLQQGQSILIPHTPLTGYVKLMNKDDVFIGVGQVQQDGKVAPRRLINS